MSIGIGARAKIVILLAALLALGVLAAPSTPAGPRRGATWTEHYFPSTDGITMLHADVLRPKGIPADRKTPVILTVSPYLNHAGSTTEYDPNAVGPNERFYDFLDLSQILDRGYTYVMVDLPGFGGSSGCNDWGGAREQGAVKAAVEWAASQPWSTGRVGMIGKSYDAWTGLMGIAQRPKGLAAVVAMEPVYSGYRYLYNDGVRFFNSVLTPVGFQAYDAKPGSLQDDPFYNANGAPQAWCYGVNFGMQQIDDPESPYWAERDLVRSTKGAKTPLFLTQGFLETNTKPDAAFAFFNGLGGKHNRAWFGQFDHYRGWEQAEGRFLMGRATFVDEMMRFLDRHVKGARTHRDPAIEVQDNLGRYRAERAWPPADARSWTTELNPGTYEDDGRNDAYGAGAGQGIWSFSQPLDHPVWLAGEPVLKAKMDAVPRANVVANVYDVAPSGRATLVSRGAHLVRGASSQEVRVDLYGQDWLFPAGHRIAVIVSGANSDWWVHIPTQTEVTVAQARITFPFLTFERDRFLNASSTPTLEGHLENRVTDVDPGTMKEASVRFNLPPRLRSR